MSKKYKIVKEFRYKFVLYITNKNKGVVCLRIFEAKDGLKDDIQHATELAMDLIYSEILLQSAYNSPAKNMNNSIISLCVYDNDVEIACVEQPLSNIKNVVVNINIKDIVKEIFDLLRK